MAPTPKTSAMLPRRLSCDRCHGQKLRCPRGGNGDNGACNRCLRQGARCVYSSSLPKGRPCMYRLADISSNPPATTPVTSESRCQRSGGRGNLSANADANSDADANANANAIANASVMEDALLAESIDMSIFTSTSRDRDRLWTEIGMIDPHATRG